MDRLRLAQIYSDKTIPDKKIEILRKLDVNYCISNEPSSVCPYDTFLGYNCLHIAVIKSDLSLTKCSLNRGVDLVKQGTRDGKTPLHIAVSEKKYCDDKLIWKIQGHLQKDPIIEILLSTQVENNIQINPKCNKGVSHLHIACMFNHTEAVEFLANIGESLDQATNKDDYILSGYTALHFAVRYSSVEAVEILLRHGADIHVRNTKGLSPLDMMIDLLLEYSEFLTRGLRAVSLPYQQEVDKLNSIINLVLEYRKADDVLNEDAGLSAFHLACMLKDSSKAKYYLESNVDVNLPVKDHWPGWRPSHFAACLNIETFKLLLQKGANFAVKNEEGYTALDLCLRNHNPEVVSTVLSSNDALTSILLSDASTKLTEALSAMSDCNRFERFLSNLTDVNIFVPLDSPIWAGYNILHLAISMNERIKPWYYCASRTDQVKWNKNQEKQYNCTEEEQLMYRKRIEMCLAKGCNVSAKNSAGLTPIHLAFKWYQGNLVNLLLSYCQQNIADSNNLSLFHIACAVGKLDSVQKFLLQEANVNDRVASSFECHSTIFYHMEEYNPKKIKLNAGSTPLHIASMFGRKKVAQILIERGGDVYAKDELGLTPIHLTMESGRYLHDVHKLLFNTPNLRDSVSDAGLSHLHVAAYTSNEQAVERLLRAGANVNQVVEKKVSGVQRCFAGRTPLHLATQHLNITWLLVRHGADVTVENPFNKYDIPLLDRCILFKAQPALSEALKKSMETGPLNSTGITRLHVACATFDLEWAEQLLKAGADPNARQSRFIGIEINCTPLHLFLEYADSIDRGIPLQTIVDLVKLMLDYGANVLLSDGLKAPLHDIYRLICKMHSAQDTDRRRYFEEMADLMLNRIDNFSDNPEDENGFSSFHLACVRNKVKIVEKFLDNGVDVNYSTYPFTKKDTAGYTPLHFALRHGSAEVARLLLERGADVKAEDRYGNTPFHCLVEGHSIPSDIVDKLLDKGADVNAKNLQEETPIEQLIWYYEFSIGYLYFFLLKGATIDVRKRNSFGEGIIGVAINNALSNESEIVLKTLIKYGKVKKAIKDGFSAIHNVVSIYRSTTNFETYMKTIDYFMKMGCELDEKNLQGHTALHSAISFDNTQAVEALLFLGADLNLVERKNEPSLLLKVMNNDNDDDDDDDDDVDDEYSEELRSALRNYLWKINFIGLDMTNFNQVFVQHVEGMPNLSTVEHLKSELNKAKLTTINQSLTLDMFLSEWRSVMRYPMMSIVQRQDIDIFFKKSSMIFEEFPELAGLMMNNYRKALSRINMMQPAKEILVRSNINLPDLCLEEILKYFKNVELEFLVEGSEEVSPPCKRQKIE